MDESINCGAKTFAEFQKNRVNIRRSSRIQLLADPSNKMFDWWFPSHVKLFAAFGPTNDPLAFTHSDPHTEPGSRSELKLEPVSESLSNSELKLEPVRKSLIGRDLIGQYIGVIPLLSNHGKTTSLVRSNGDIVSLSDAVRSKYLVICCYSVPLPNRSLTASYSRSIISAYSELHSSNFDVEIVMVAKMKTGFADDRAVFDHFFSEFPCLAIPFCEVETRDYICSRIGGSDMSAVVIDPRGIVLHHRATPRLFHKYGSEGFPFYEDSLEAIDTKDEVFKMRLDPFYAKGHTHLSKAFKEYSELKEEPLSLHKDILQCNLQQTFPRFRSSGQPLSVSELSKKYVWLYLCITGDFLETLVKAYQLCVSENLDFEIVLVCLPILDNPKSYIESLTEALDRYNVESWFLFQEAKVCRRLWRTFALQWDCDRLIILPPNCKSCEIEGKAVITKFEVEDYPFTRSSILTRRLEALRPLKPKPHVWFNGTSDDYTCLKFVGEKCNVRKSVIKGKNLLLYLDWLKFSDGGKLCRWLMKHYSEIKNACWEVVFIPLDDVEYVSRNPDFSKMPWLIMPVSDAVKCDVLKKLLLEKEDDNRIVAVDRDGTVLSRQVEKRIEENKGFSQSLVSDFLSEEITDRLVSLEDNYY